VSARSVAAVLLSTYNGERFLSEQLDTILNQSLREIALIVRDDGSTDSTVAILDARAARDSRVIVHRGTNLGVIASFLELVRIGVEHGAPVLFFADQDDVWHREKLAAMAARVMKGDGKRPALHYCAVRLVDAEGRSLRRELPLYPVPRFGQAIAQGIAQGCVMAFNAALARLIADYQPNPQRLVMHDIWVMMIATAFGTVTCEPTRFVDYRQHGRNVLGGQTGLDLLGTRLERLVRRKNAGRLAAQAREFRRLFKNLLMPEHLRTLDDFLDASTAAFPRRAVAAWSRRFGRFGFVEDMMLRLLLVAGLQRTSLSLDDPSARRLDGSTGV
jgi:glycosyltransferase involved in cell wall biosynthesis